MNPMPLASNAFGYAGRLWAQLLGVALASLLLLGAERLHAKDEDEPPGGNHESSRQGGRTKVALVIGNAAYRFLPQLANARNDAADVCEVLKSIGFDATCILDIPTRREFREAILAFAARAGSSVGAEAFVFYAGHGLQSRGENYLIPVESQILSEADVDFEGVGLSYLLASLEQARSYPSVIVLDACRDNPFGDNVGFRVAKGLARAEPPVGTVLAYATSPNKAALDGSGRNGLFTKHLLTRLPVPGLQLDEMFRQVSRAVEDEAKNAYRYEQVPYRSSSFSASYCLAGCEDPKFADKAKAIEAERVELNRKLQEVSGENERLRAQAKRGAEEIAELERRVARLLLEEGAKGQRDADVGRALERARSELESVRADQARRDAREKENERRMAELEGLRDELRRQVAEIDEYRKKIRDLESARARSARPDDDPRARSRRPGVIVPSF